MCLYIISQPWTQVADFDELYLCILHAESYDPWCIHHIVSGTARMTNHSAQCKLRQEVDNLAGDGLLKHCALQDPTTYGHPIIVEYRVSRILSTNHVGT